MSNCDNQGAEPYLFHYEWSRCVRFLLGFTVPGVVFGGQTLAAHGSRTNGTDSGLVETKKCNNVYFYEAPNKKIESMLREMTGRLIKLQDDVNKLIRNKNVQNRKSGPISFVGNLSFHFVCF